LDRGFVIREVVVLVGSVVSDRVILVEDHEDEVGTTPRVTAVS
jgi:hypothetical protein